MRPAPRLACLAAAALLQAGVPAATVAGLPAQALARGAPDSFADLAASLLPAVVNISSTETVTGDAPEDDDDQVAAAVVVATRARVPTCRHSRPARRSRSSSTTS